MKVVMFWYLDVFDSSCFDVFCGAKDSTGKYPKKDYLRHNQCLQYKPHRKEVFLKILNDSTHHNKEPTHKDFLSQSLWEYRKSWNITVQIPHIRKLSLLRIVHKECNPFPIGFPLRNNLSSPVLFSKFRQKRWFLHPNV